jgi:hypothetical protein
MKTEIYEVTVDEGYRTTWRQNGKIHRVGGPAVECEVGDKFWYQNGMYNREDGPAVEYADGSGFWYLNDMLHREDGPALEYADGSRFWFLDSRKLTEAEHAAEMKRRNAPSCDGKTVEIDGVKYKPSAV